MTYYIVRGAVWLLIYLLFILAPVFALLAGTHLPARDFWTEFSAALGYSGLAMMGLQFCLTARFRYVTEAFGEDVIYYFHRKVSLVAVGLVLAHPVILFVIRPELLGLLNSISAPWRARFAALSTYSLIALVVTSLWRAKLKIKYEIWQLTHVVLAVVAVLAGLLHMAGWAFYLTDSWKRGLWRGMTTFWILLLLYVRLFKPLFILRRPYRVSQVRSERGDTWTLMMYPDRHQGFRFKAGQFAWLTVWGSPFKISAHPFSISSSASAPDRRVEISIKSLGDFTSNIHKVPVGKRVYLDGPYGGFHIGNPADMHVLIAGGVGITPMMSMMRTLADQRDSRPVILLYGSRDWESITFREDLEALKDRLQLTIVHVLQKPPADWTGEQGFINGEVLQRHLPPPYAEHEYFICGPDVMMDPIEKALQDLQVPMSKYHSERYSFL